MKHVPICSRMVRCKGAIPDTGLVEIKADGTFVIDTIPTEIRSDIKNRTEYSLDARIVCISEQHNRSNWAFFIFFIYRLMPQG